MSRNFGRFLTPSPVKIRHPDDRDVIYGQPLIISAIEKVKNEYQLFENFTGFLIFLLRIFFFYNCLNQIFYNIETSVLQRPVKIFNFSVKKILWSKHEMTK